MSLTIKVAYNGSPLRTFTIQKNALPNWTQLESQVR